MAAGDAAVEREVRFGVCVDVKGELLDFLAVDQVEMNGVGVGGQVDHVKVVGFADLVSAVGAVHPVHH